MSRTAPARYEVRTRFEVPLEFAYRWCTDYSAKDPALEGERFARQVLSRTASEVRYEDLEGSPDGWQWSRWTVTLRPPDRWHAEARGNYRDWSVDYRLTDRGDGSTEFLLVGRRRPALLGTANPPRRELEADLAKAWRKFATAMLRDYRARRPRGRAR